MMNDWFLMNISRCEDERDKCSLESDRRLWNDALEVYRHLMTCRLRHSKIGDPMSPMCEEKYG